MWWLCAAVASWAAPDYDALDRLYRLRRARATQSAAMVGAWGGVEMVGGGVVLATGVTDPLVGAGALAGGFAHVATSWYSAELGRRRYRAWAARRPFLERAPAEAWTEAVSDLRLSVEREGRAHAFATGTYAGVAVAGAVVALWLPADDHTRLLGAVAAGVGVTGLVHHSSRWRFCIRLSVDADGLLRGAPTSAGFDLRGE